MTVTAMTEGEARLKANRRKFWRLIGKGALLGGGIGLGVGFVSGFAAGWRDAGGAWIEQAPAPNLWVLWGASVIAACAVYGWRKLSTRF